MQAPRVAGARGLPKQSPARLVDQGGQGSQPSLVGTKVRSARRTWFDADFVKLLPILFDAIA